MKSRIGAAALMVAIGVAIGDAIGSWGADAESLIDRLGGSDTQSFNDKLYRAQEEEMLEKAKYVGWAHDQCGTHLAAKIDWTAVPPEFAGKELPPRPPTSRLVKSSAAGYCFNVFGALDQVCKTEAGQTAVRQKVQTIVCGFGPERTIELKDGVLTFKMNADTYNNEDFIREYLLNNL